MIYDSLYPEQPFSPAENCGDLLRRLLFARIVTWLHKLSVHINNSDVSIPSFRLVQQTSLGGALESAGWTLHRSPKSKQVDTSDNYYLHDGPIKPLSRRVCQS